MSAGPIQQVAVFDRNIIHLPPPQRLLKRKFDALLSVCVAGGTGYPSPPMSQPPSPPRQTPVTTTRDEGALTREVPTTSQPPQQLPPPKSSQESQMLSTLTRGPTPSVFGQPRVQQGPSTPAFPFPSSTSISFEEQPTTTTRAAESTTTRTVRRSKAHVPSACVNCKRAHLSCDVQRPCTRCVASGKQDTCYDVQHKKRGRPRLREESEFRIEQMLHNPEAGPSRQPATAGPSAPRLIAGTRHRRTESLRSLRSSGSDVSPASSLSTPLYPPPLGLMLPPSLPPHPSAPLSPADVPTAFLDLDLVFLKANAPFIQILGRGRDVAGLRLADVAAPYDNESFSIIRDRLKAERDERDPTYMPPIVPQGHRHLEGVSEEDAERLSAPYSERTYIWTHGIAEGVAENFPARLRLAKADIYFVVVTLPTFRPVINPSPMMGPPPQTSPRQLQPPMMPPPPPPPQDPYGAYRPPQMSPYAPPPGPPSSPQQHYPPYQAGSPSLQFPPPPPPPRLLAAEPPSSATPYTPPIGAREQERVLQPPLQLPPLLSSTPAQAGPSSGPAPPAAAGSSQQQGHSTDDDEDESSPRKRRRTVMGIDDVLSR